MTSLRRAASVADFRELARRRLPNILFEYIDGGSYSEETLDRNTADFRRLSLRQRVMCDMTQLEMSVQTLGQNLSMPVILSPVGLAGMYARRGEVQAARAAAAAGLPFCLSTLGICDVNEIARGAAVAPWYQLYILKDRGFTREALRRARAAGSPVLVLTVDLPVPGARYRDVRSGFRGLGGWRAFLNQAIDGARHPRWLWDVWLHGRPHQLGSLAGALKESESQDYLTWIAQNFDRSVTWRDVDFVREEWDGPIVIKGVLDPQDAADAVKAGVQGIVVSNHGGRQLDGVLSSVSALPRIVDLVGADLEIYLDSGVRSGLDVLKAVALGAKACLIGRAWAYALAAGGGKAVSMMLATLRAELEVAMVLTGCNSVRSAGRELLDAG